MEAITTAQRKSNRNIYRFIMALSAAGVLGIIIYSVTQASDKLMWLSVSLVLALACFLVGGLVGFLFGIPKMNTNYQSDNTNEYTANTSLEEIADWLTKIIVGLGLTQLMVIPGYLYDVSEKVVRGIIGKTDGAAGDTTYVLALILLFALLGFFFAYFFARLELTSKFVDVNEHEKILEQEAETKNKLFEQISDMSEETSFLKKRVEDKVEQEKELLTTKAVDLKKILSTNQKQVLSQLLASPTKSYVSKPGLLNLELDELVKLNILSAVPTVGGEKFSKTYTLTDEYKDLKSSDFE